MGKPDLSSANIFQELRAEYETARTIYLMESGIEVLRFENREVHENLEVVLETIRDAIRKRDRV